MAGKKSGGGSKKTTSKAPESELSSKATPADPTPKVATAVPKPKTKASAAPEEPTVRQYQVNPDAAFHTEQDGTRYEPGEVVETTAPLAQMFPNKFKEVKDGKYVGDNAIPAPKKRYNADNTTENDDGTVHGPSVEADEGADAEEDVTATDEDVTEELFPAAVELKYRVFALADGTGYEVRTEEGERVNDDPLGERDDVNRFLNIE